MNLQIQKLGLSNFSLIMKRRRFLIFSIVLIVVVLVMIGTLASPSLYRTKAQIIIERKSPNVSPPPNSTLCSPPRKTTTRLNIRSCRAGHWPTRFWQA